MVLRIGLTRMRPTSSPIPGSFVLTLSRRSRHWARPRSESSGSGMV